MIRMSDDQPEDQRIVQTWETPTHAEIVDLTRAHVAGMEVSDDDIAMLGVGGLLKEIPIRPQPREG